MGIFEKLSILNRFLKVFSVSKKLLVVIVFLMTIQALVEAFSAGLLIPFLNSFQSVQTSAEETNRFLSIINNMFASIDVQYRFIYILLLIIGLMGLVQLMAILNNRFILKFCMLVVQNTVSNALFKKIMTVRLKFFYDHRSGDLINNLTMDVNRSFNCIQYLIQISTAVFFCLGYLVIGMLFLPVYTLCLLGFIVAFGLGFKKILPYISNLGLKNRRAQEDANNIVVESMQGFRNIVLSCAETETIKKFSGVIFDFYHTIYRSSWITTSLPYFIKFLVFLMVGIIIWINLARMHSGNPEIVSSMVFFAFVAANVVKYLGHANNMYASFEFSLGGVKALLKLESELRQLQGFSQKQLTSISGFSDDLCVEELSFSHVPGETILQDLSFTIPRNRKVAFVGRSGSGKTTLIDIMTGFHDDYRGSITIDGCDFREMDKAEWRYQLGYVSQETFVFNDTVKKNLTFGFDREIPKRELEEVCQKAQILDTISGFENGFETVLGERGIRLSGGEKQRLAIARLLLKKPSLVFLDEATSALDSESEKKVKEALYALSRGRTVIAVAHRLSTISDYDVIHVLEKGRIVESGSHAELIDRKGQYFKYYTLQTMEESQ